MPKTKMPAPNLFPNRKILQIQTDLKKIGDVEAGMITKARLRNYDTKEYLALMRGLKRAKSIGIPGRRLRLILPSMNKLKDVDMNLAVSSNLIENSIDSKSKKIDLRDIHSDMRVIEHDMNILAAYLTILQKERENLPLQSGDFSEVKRFHLGSTITIHKGIEIETILHPAECDAATKSVIRGALGAFTSERVGRNIPDAEMEDHVINIYILVVVRQGAKILGFATAARKPTGKKKEHILIFTGAVVTKNSPDRSLLIKMHLMICKTYWIERIIREKNIFVSFPLGLRTASKSVLRACVQNFSNEYDPVSKINAQQPRDNARWLATIEKALLCKVNKKGIVDAAFDEPVTDERDRIDGLTPRQAVIITGTFGIMTALRASYNIIKIGLRFRQRRREVRLRYSFKTR